MKEIIQYFQLSHLLKVVEEETGLVHQVVQVVLEVQEAVQLAAAQAQLVILHQFHHLKEIQVVLQQVHFKIQVQAAAVPAQLEVVFQVLLK
tara:strand:+ start:248 stop:520 length:273 start_codon:yes stop_codon:yes gene_type:complete